MKTIIIYIAILVLLGVAGFFGVRNVQLQTQVKTQQNEIVRKDALIKELAQQEAIAIHITNEFKSSAVLGKVVVDANVKNVAEQCASILKGELNTVPKPIK
jgi:Tfp pilus assembly protein PilN